MNKQQLRQKVLQLVSQPKKTPAAIVYAQYIQKRNTIAEKLLTINQTMLDVDANTQNAIDTYNTGMESLLSLLPEISSLNIPAVPFSDYLVTDKNLLSKYTTDLYSYTSFKRKLASDFAVGATANPPNYNLSFNLVSGDVATAPSGWDNIPSNDVTQIGNNWNFVTVAQNKYFGL